jgi:hypothetical protein
MARKTAKLLTLGAQYGPLTLDYARRVESVGGRFDVAGRALRLINNLFYGQYSNGAGGVDSVAAIAHLLPVLWFPVSNFAGMPVPIIGAQFTSTGYTAGNYSLANGLQGNTSSFLNSNWSTAFLTISHESGIWFWSNSAISSNPGTAAFMGQSGVSGTNNFDIGLGGGGGAIRSRIYSANASSRSVAAEYRFYFGFRISTGTIGIILNTTKFTESQSFANPGDRNVFFGARNSNGTANLHWTNLYSAAGVVNGVLTDPQATTLYNALDAANTARATL